MTGDMFFHLVEPVLHSGTRLIDAPQGICHDVTGQLLELAAHPGAVDQLFCGSGLHRAAPGGEPQQLSSEALQDDSKHQRATSRS